MKKIYIAGKVTGENRAECTAKFALAKKEIEALGFEAINPLEVVGHWDTPWNPAMRKCIGALMECDAIVLLPDWISSRGAKIEYEISKFINIPDFRATKFGLNDLSLHKWNN